MSLQPWRTLRTLAVCCAAFVLAGSHLSAQKEFSSATNRKLGQAAVQFKDKMTHVVAAYYYSQRNHDSRWIVIQSAVSTTREAIIHREDIVLRTPQGRDIPLATQTRVGEEVTKVEQLLQNAKVQSHNVTAYFPQQDRFEDMQLFRLPFGPVVHNEFIVDRDRVAVGSLFFESPTGAWEKGTYTLVVKHKNGTAELPIILE
jgi:hypothetical protein